MLHSVDYFGHRISENGLQPMEEKVRAITEAPPPTEVSQLRLFLGLNNYYAKFLPNLANTLAPLYRKARNGHEENHNKQHSERQKCN